MLGNKSPPLAFDAGGPSDESRNGTPRRSLLDSQRACSTDSDSALPRTFQAAITALQVEFHRQASDRLRWSTERSVLQQRVAELESALSAQKSLNEMLSKRVHMLEFALKQERLGRGATPAIPAGAHELPPPPSSPAIGVSHKPRASQVIVREYLTSLGYSVSTDLEQLTADHDAAISAARKVGVKTPPLMAPASATPALEQPLKADGPTAGSPSGVRPWAQRRIDTGAASSPAPKAAPASPRTLAMLDDVIIHNGDDAKTETVAPSNQAHQRNGSAPAAVTHSSAPAPAPGDSIAASIQEMTDTGSRSRGFAGARTHNTASIPITWIPNLPCRSHMDVIRFVRWLDADALETGNGCGEHVHVPLLASCSDDGTIKMWTSPQHARLARLHESSSGSSHAVQPKVVVAHLTTNRDADPEPIRTYRGHIGPALRVAQSVWHVQPDGSDVQLDGLRIVNAQQLLASALQARGIRGTAPGDLLQSLSSSQSIVHSVGADGYWMCWVKPKDVVSSETAEKGWPSSILPLSYELPAESSLPIFRHRVSAGAVWSLGGVPAGFSLRDAFPNAFKDDSVANSKANNVDSNAAPVIFTVSQEGVLAFWIVGLEADERIGCRKLTEIQTSQWVTDVHITDAVIDMTSATLSVFLSTTGGDLLKVRVSDGKLMYKSRIRDENTRITALAVHPLMPLLFASTTDTQMGVCVFDTLSGRRVASFATHSSETTAVAVDAAGVLLGTSGNDGDVRVWSIDTKECVWRTKAHSSRFSEAAQFVAFGPGRTHVLASAGADSIVKIFTGKVSGGGSSMDVKPATARVGHVRFNAEPTAPADSGRVSTATETSVAPLESIRPGKEEAGFGSSTSTTTSAKPTPMPEEDASLPPDESGATAFAGRFANRSMRGRGGKGSSMARVMAAQRNAQAGDSTTPPS